MMERSRAEKITGNVCGVDEHRGEVDSLQQRSLAHESLERGRPSLADHLSQTRHVTRNQCLRGVWRGMSIAIQYIPINVNHGLFRVSTSKVLPV